MEEKRGIKRECSPSVEGNHLPDDTKTPPPAPSGKSPMIDPSSFIVDTSCDEDLARKLFGDLNHDILEPPGDSKIIVLDDSNDDGEAQEEKTVGIESTAAPASADDAPAWAKIGNSDD
jgi:hypothetical protein